LPAIFQEIAKEKNLPLGDFPDPKILQEKLAAVDFASLPKVDKKNWTFSIRCYPTMCQSC